MYQELIYKALARDPLYFGIPLVPLLLVGVSGFALALLIYFPLLLLVLLVLFIMKKLTDQDEQLFRQLFLYWQLNRKRFPNRFYWKEVYSFAPVVAEPVLVISEADRRFFQKDTSSGRH